MLYEEIEEVACWALRRGMMNDGMDGMWGEGYVRGRRPASENE